MKRTLRNTLIALIAFSSSALAAGSTGAGEGSLLLSLFIGFFTLIVVLPTGSGRSDAGRDAQRDLWSGSERDLQLLN